MGRPVSNITFLDTFLLIFLRGRLLTDITGSFEYFAAHLKPLATYRDLKSEVLQAFREVGNVVIVVKIVEDILVHFYCLVGCDFGRSKSWA